MSQWDRSQDEASTGGVGAVALAWLPPGDYEQAVQLWPELARSDRARSAGYLVVQRARPTA